MSPWKRRMRWIFRRGLCFGGLVGALIFFCVSLTPSLLPRGWLFQGVVTGVNLAIGYGVGSGISALARKLGAPEPSLDVKRWFWRGLLVVAIVLVPTFVWWGGQWNQATRELMGMTDLEPFDWVSILILSVVLFAFLMLISRIVRLGTRWINRMFNRWVPRPWNLVVGFTVAAVLLVGFISGVLIDSAFEAINKTYSLSDKDTTPGFVQPESSLRSGSAESLVAWDTLGTKGRDFTGEGGGTEKDAGPNASDIEAFTGSAAMEPIRAYVGLRSADSLDERVELAMAELERTDAFERSIVAVYATTGTGWIDERVADSLEYMWGGDTAAVGMQYSYLPSWVSVLVDSEKAADTSEAMIGAVVAKVNELPEAERPRVLVFGESLGSFATESAFEDLDEMVSTVDGAMLVGPTFGNDMRNHFTDNRDEGSPAWRPEYEEGSRVRFAVDPADLELLEGPWDEPRVVYLQNSSDPIAHFAPELLWSSPEWLDDPRAPDSNPDMFWFPIVTFWQVTADLTYSFGAPAGHGHRYGANVVDGWVVLGAPEGWTDEDTQRLRDLVGHE